jgi:hypothetical protein
MTDNLRSIVLVFVKRFNRTRLNLMAANMILRGIASMSPEQRAKLTSEQIQAELKDCQRQLEKQPDPAGIEIEQVLSGTEPFENALGKFVANLQW